jgi:hypothetical protein
VRNLLILGSGRSGTSMTAALFAETGAWQGESSYRPRAANPFGFYEDAEINRLNDELIVRMLAGGWRRLLWELGPRLHRDPRALWLAAPRRLRRVEAAPEQAERMRKHAGRTPFCLKDPRFGLTLPAWRPHLPAGTRFVVVFRHPDVTVDSMLREARESYAPPLPLDAHFAYLSWRRMYRRLLRHARQGEWFFASYDQLASGEALPALEAFAETALCPGRIRPEASRARLRRSPLSGAARARNLYAELERRARQDLARFGPAA